MTSVTNQTLGGTKKGSLVSKAHSQHNVVGKGGTFNARNNNNFVTQNSKRSVVNKHLIKQQFGPYTHGSGVKMKGRIQKGRPSGGGAASPSSSLTRMLTSTNNHM